MPDNKFRTSWVTQNVTQSRVTIRDLKKVPTFSPGQVYDLLEFETVEDIQNSESLTNLVNSKWLALDVEFSPDHPAPIPDAFLKNVIEDLTPELGGNLDALNHHIGFTEQQIEPNINTTTINWGDGNKAYLTLKNSSVQKLAFADPPTSSNLMLKIVQGLTGGNLIATWDSSIRWTRGEIPVLSTTPGSIDIIAFYFDGESYYGVASLNFF